MYKCESQGSRSTRRTTRVQLLSSLLTAGLNVTLADADAVALGPIGRHLGVADVVASRGSFPRWGAF